MLRISEGVLLTELNKILIQERRKNEKERYREAESAPQPAEVNDFDTPSKVDVGSMVQYQEQETVRLLLNYADENLEDQKLSDFLFHELEEVEFVNPEFGEIYTGLKEGWEKGEPRTSHYFLEQGNEKIKKVVTDLIAHRYDLSVHWGDKYHIHIPREGDILNEMAYTNVLRLKLRVIQKMLDENKDKIKVAEQSGHESEVDNFLMTQIGLDQAKKELSEILGIVIAR